MRGVEGDVLYLCARPCDSGAVYVPEVGPMGDEHCTTVDEAVATGVRWRWSVSHDGYLCPSCWDVYGVGA